MIDREYTEKRSYMRMNMDAPATVELDGTRKHCTCRDLSAVGMLLELDEAVALETELRVHVPAFSNQFSPLDANVRVTRVNELDDNRYRLGVEIIEMLYGRRPRSQWPSAAGAATGPALPPSG